MLLTLEGSLDVERPHRDGGHHQVGERQRKHEFPREPKELVVPEARQRPPHPNLEAAYQQHLHQEYEELDQHDDASQTMLVEATGIDRSTLAEMVRRMLDRGLLSRSRTEQDARANAISITPTGRRTLRGARLAAERAERALLDLLRPIIGARVRARNL